MEDVGSTSQDNLITLASEIVAAFVSSNHVQVSDLPNLIASTHAALAGLGNGGEGAAPSVEKPTPAQIRKSLTHDALISFIDGKPYKTLKRHLTGHGLTFEGYRERYGLPQDYPSTAPGYSQARSALARSLGLGRPRKAASEPSSVDPGKTATDKPKRTPRARKGAAVET